MLIGFSLFYLLIGLDFYFIADDGVQIPLLYIIIEVVMTTTRSFWSKYNGFKLFMTFVFFTHY